MKHEELIVELEEIAKQLGVSVRYEKGDFDGGYCILREKKILVVNKKLLPNKKASALALALFEVGLEDRFLKPVVRAFVEDEAARAGKSIAGA